MSKPLCWLVFSFILAAQPTFAHAILIDGAPAIAATVPAGPLAIRLRFNSRIDADRSRLTLVAPDATPNILRQTPAEAPNLLEATTSVVAGRWMLRWQVLAVDGHITRGEVPFTVGPLGTDPAAAGPHVASQP